MRTILEVSVTWIFILNFGARALYLIYMSLCVCVILCLLSSFCDGHFSNLGDPGLRLAGWKGSVVALPPLFEELHELENLSPWGGDRTLATVAYCLTWIWRPSAGTSWLGSEAALRLASHFGERLAGLLCRCASSPWLPCPWESTPPSPHLDLKSSV